MVLAVAILGNGIGLALLPTFPGTSHEHTRNSFDPTLGFLSILWIEELWSFSKI